MTYMAYVTVFAYTPSLVYSLRRFLSMLTWPWSWPSNHVHWIMAKAMTMAMAMPTLMGMAA